MKLADYFTLGNLASGMVSIYFALQQDFMLASIFILVGVFFDYIDGKVARLTGVSKLGAQLDSLCDAITFGVAVAFLLFMKYQILYFGIILIFFVMAGVYRLARFNITPPKKGFEGTPITLNGVVFPILVIVSVNYYVILSLVILLSFTMVSKIKVPHA